MRKLSTRRTVNTFSFFIFHFLFLISNANFIIMKYLLFFLASYASYASFGQSTCPVKRGYAFYTVHMPGTIRVDEQGNQVRPDPMVERVIYLEAAPSLKIMPDSVLYGSRYSKLSTERLKGLQVNAGKQSGDGKYFKFTARKGYVLWKLQLETMSERSGAPLNCRQIVIRTKQGGRTCKFYLYKETELEGMPRY